MPCPTCGHTLSHLTDAAPALHWCERCGTITVGLPDATGVVHAHAPKLVERCRDYAKLVNNVGGIWRTLGIAESIHLPGERE